MRWRAVVWIALAACESQGSGAASGSAGAKTAENATQKGSAGGFSASLSADLAKEPGSAAATAPAPAAPPAAKGSAASTPAAPAPAAKGSPAPPAPTGPSVAGVATPGPPATPPTQAVAPQKGPAGKGVLGPVAAPPNRAPVKPPPEIAAIKLDLEPNWERDVGEAGTFSLVVKLPNNANDTRLFQVRYGYEDQSAPFDCDQYRKFLEDKKLMTVSLNRQRGAACYIEGKTPEGVISYRYLVNYGGKRLMCHGSLYKDQASASLGDLRDKVLMQAKKICETLAL